MNDLLILCDTRQQKDKYITNYFDEKNIPWLRTMLPSADYMALRYENGFIKDYSILIDTKKDVEEISGNLCNTTEHERIKREIAKAKDLGCQEFIFLICDSKIKNADDLKKWTSKHTKVKGNTLYKIMKTMSEKYDVKFMFCNKRSAGRFIYNLLNKKVGC